MESCNSHSPKPVPTKHVNWRCRGVDILDAAYSLETKDGGLTLVEGEILVAI